jgi:hypothetical protein
MRSIFRRLALASTLALLLLVANAVSAAESAEDLVEKGKVYEKKFQAKDALPYYLAAEKLEPLFCHVLVRSARQYR